MKVQVKTLRGKNQKIISNELCVTIIFSKGGGRGEFPEIFAAPPIDIVGMMHSR